MQHGTLPMYHGTLAMYHGTSAVYHGTFSYRNAEDKHTKHLKQTKLNNIILINNNIHPNIAYKSKNYLDKINIFFRLMSNSVSLKRFP